MVPFAEPITVITKSKPTGHQSKIDVETGKPWAETTSTKTIMGSVQTAKTQDTARFTLRAEGMTGSSYMKVYSEDVIKLNDVIEYSRGGFKMSMTVIDVDIFQYDDSSMNHYCYYCIGALTNE